MKAKVIRINEITFVVKIYLQDEHWKAVQTGSHNRRRFLRQLVLRGQCWSVYSRSMERIRSHHAWLQSVDRPVSTITGRMLQTAPCRIIESRHS